MAYETKFISGATAKTLSTQVQKAERDGWEYVDVKLAMAPVRPNDKDPPNYHVYMLATLRRLVD
ncbi:hypothetical protein WMF01_47720 [Sorangium sp. So ce1667]